MLEASKERPYLALRLELAPTLVGGVLAEAGHTWPRAQAEMRAISVSPLDLTILDAIVRLVRLVEAPDDAAVLQPLYTREIIYRLLRGEQGALLRYLAFQGATPPRLPERSSASGRASISLRASSIWHRN